MSATAKSSLKMARTFELSFCLGKPCDAVAQEVLDNMQPAEVGIFRLDNDRFTGDRRLKRFPLADGGILASGHVSAKDWLPLVCQRIRWGCVSDLVTPTEYVHTIRESLVNPPDNSGNGVENFYGEIHLNCEYRGFFEAGRFKDVLSFLIAHAILHALGSIPLVLPAFLDWEAYRESFRNGTNSEWETDRCLGDPHWVFRGEWSQHEKSCPGGPDPFEEIARSSKDWPSNYSSGARQIELFWPVALSHQWLRAAGEFNPRWFSFYGDDPCC